MKKICIVTTVAYQNDSRALKQLISLSKNGYSVVGVEFEKSDNFEFPENIDLIRPMQSPQIKPTQKPRHNIFGWIEKKIVSCKNIFRFYFLNCIYYPMRIIPSSDLYIMHSPFPFLPIFFRTRNKRAKFIYDAHEYYLGQGDIYQNTILKKIYDFLLGKIEKYSIHYSNATLTVSPGISKVLKKKYAAEPVVIMNVHDRTLDKVSKRGNIRDYFKKEDFIVLMSGNGKNCVNINLLVEAVLSLDRKYKLVLVGKNHNRFIDNSYLKFINDRIYIFDDLVANEIVPFIKGSDLGVVLVDNTYSNFKYCLPNKLFQYISAEIPILTSDLEDVNMVVKKNKIGEIFRINSAQSLEKSIYSISSGKPMLPSMKIFLRRAEKKYNWKIEEKKFITVLENLEE
ncbi:hypothetical protein JXA84_05170 [candidate division WOR-3 bacterium]|nr:hypothetical protein [candidate division WOR-3 bacterium]